MNDQHIIKISKYLSKHLRHKPEKIGIQLEEGGWVEVATLLAAAAQNGFPITLSELHEVVANNNKQRFAFDPTGRKIRANQGHSVEIDLQLEPQIPPDVLYHGTATRFLELILREGLQKMQRHHVHLSADEATARNVGARHGKPVVLRINAQAMAQAGFQFYCSANGVWLVEHVPVAFIMHIP